MSSPKLKSDNVLFTKPKTKNQKPFRNRLGVKDRKCYSVYCIISEISQFFEKRLGLSPLGIRVFRPCACVTNKFPDIKAWFRALQKNTPILFQKHL
jgi:hypothetical protein